MRNAIEELNPADLALYPAATTRFEQLLIENPVPVA